MKNKKVYVFCDDRLDYIAKLKENKIKLKFSKDSAWSEHIQDTKIGELEDHGNGIAVKMGDIDLNLGYDEFVELYFLLHVKMKEDKTMVGKVKYLKK